MGVAQGGVDDPDFGHGGPRRGWAGKRAIVHSGPQPPTPPAETKATVRKHDRYRFSIIDERPDHSWLGGRRLAFYLSTNVGYYAFGTGLGWDLARHDAPQTQRNYSWRDYGNRVGLWRLLDICDELKLPVAHNVNSLLYDFQPEVFKRLRARGDEFIGHGAAGR